MKHVAIIILSYNSEKDLQICVKRLLEQEGVRSSIIIVDNASRPESVNEVESWLNVWCPLAIRGTPQQVSECLDENPSLAARDKNVYFIKNQENRGYSAGNNTGIRLADKLGADAVLIANPDIRIESSDCIGSLTFELFSDTQVCIVGPRILDHRRRDQNPLKEPSFWEEVLWVQLFKSFYLKLLHTKDLKKNEVAKSVYVLQLAGCFLLIKMDFLIETNYLDENVFLFREEAILAAKARVVKKKLLYVPSVTVVHADVSQIERNFYFLRQWHLFKSKIYYLNKYSKYSFLQRLLLVVSNGLLMMVLIVRKSLILLFKLLKGKFASR